MKTLLQQYKNKTQKSTIKTLRIVPFAMLLASVSLISSTGEARTKLVTLPNRAELVVNLEKPHTTLLSETREIPLQKGTNYIDFSWQGVSIDSGSIKLTPLSNPGNEPNSTKVINVNFPPNESALTWQVFSPESRTERVRVSYQLYGVQRESQYTMVVNEAETEASFQHYIQMRNSSGEELGDAAIRLTGTDDLVRSIDAGESRKFLVTNKPLVPVDKLYVTRPGINTSSSDNGEPISLVYEFRNSTEDGLGNYLLPYGKVRLFGKDPSGSTIFLGEDYVQDTALGESLKLSLGTVKDILYKRRVVSDKRVNERRNNSNRTILFDREVFIRYEVENFKDQPATLRIVEQLPPDAELVDLPSNVTWKRTGTNEVEINMELKPRSSDDQEKVPVQELTFYYKISNLIQ